MAEQLALADATLSAQPAPSAWKWAREKWPGRKIVRVIDLRQKQQAFVLIAEDSGFLSDGATHFLHTPATEMSPAQHAAIIAEYDIAWRDWRPAA